MDCFLNAHPFLGLFLVVLGYCFAAFGLGGLMTLRDEVIAGRRRSPKEIVQVKMHTLLRRDQ